MSVSEDKVPGEEVGRVKAQDPDMGDNAQVNYHLIDGDGMAVFELSTDSETKEAVIKLKKVRRTQTFLAPVFREMSVSLTATCSNLSTC